MPEGLWGPPDGIDSNDYELMMEGTAGPTSRPVSIVGHSLTSPNQELSEALTFTTVVKKGGKIVKRRVTKRAAEEIGRTYTVGFPSTLWTPALARAWSGAKTTFYMKYLCSSDSQYDHAYVLPESTMNPPIEAEDPITTGDDTNILTQTSELSIDERLTLWALGYFETVTLAGAATTAINSISVLEEDCGDNVNVSSQSYVAVGGSGNLADEGFAAVTDDRFATVTDISNITGTGSDYFHSSVSVGNTVVASSTASNDLSATAGTLHVSASRGEAGTWNAASGFAKPVYGLARMGEYIVGVGKGGTVLAAGPSGMCISSNQGASFEEITSSALGQANTILRDAAYDEDKARLYVVGTDSSGGAGKVLVATESGGDITVVDISANILSLAPTSLTQVAVLAEDHIAVAGASGFYAESRDGGTTWSKIAVGTTDAITALDGNVHRVVLGATTKLFERTILSNNDFTQITLQDGATVTGNYTAITMGLEGDMNSFIAGTSAGEIVAGRPFYPGA